MGYSERGSDWGEELLYQRKKARPKGEIIRKKKRSRRCVALLRLEAQKVWRGGRSQNEMKSGQMPMKNQISTKLNLGKAYILSSVRNLN